MKSEINFELVCEGWDAIDEQIKVIQGIKAKLDTEIEKLSQMRVTVIQKERNNETPIP